MIFKEVIKRLKELDFDTETIFLSKDFLLHRNWSEVVEIIKYLKQEFNINFVKKFILSNKKYFTTSSKLKNNLKKEGIIIQVIKGEFNLTIN